MKIYTPLCKTVLHEREVGPAAVVEVSGRPQGLARDRQAHILDTLELVLCHTSTSTTTVLQNSCGLDCAVRVFEFSMTLEDWMSSPSFYCWVSWSSGLNLNLRPFRSQERDSRDRKSVV